jgi:hypothetical protein
MADYYAIMKGEYVQMDVRTFQLEIYEDEESALKRKPAGCDVVEITVKRKKSKEGAKNVK